MAIYVKDARALPNLQNWIMPTLDENMRKSPLIRRPTRGTLGSLAKFSRCITAHGQPSHEDRASRSSGIELSRHSYGCTECHWLNASTHSEEAVSGFGNQGLITIAAPFRRGIRT